MNPKPGRYKHFKGNTYEVIGVAKHSETQEELVIYKGKNEQLWARPKQMFLETIEREGNKMRRFEPIIDSKDQNI